MGKSSCYVLALAIALSLVIFPGNAFAQGSGITGEVVDSSGAILPGVTVEASSPALIEQVRTAVTDGSGRYRFTDLRPGVYAVTFVLPGFNTFVRDELELPDVFVMTIDAQMTVGSLEETITVTGAAPLVDIQNVAQSEVLSRDVTEAVLAGRFIQNYITYVPGVTGATLGFVGTDTRKFFIHGGRVWDSIIAIDGFSVNFVPGFGGNSSFYANQASIQETSIQTAAQPAEQQFGGIWINLIPKEGGNRFSGYSNFTYLNEGMVGQNLDAEQKGVGLIADSTTQILGFEPAGGGPIIADKLWFYSAARYYIVDRNRSMHFDVDPLDWVYTPDLSRPAHTSRLEENDWNLRLTAQLTPRNKLMLYFDQQPHYFHQRNFANQVAPEATNYASYWPNSVSNITWKSTVSNNLLLEAGANVYLTGIDRMPVRDPGFGNVDPQTIIPARESTTGIGFRVSGGVAAGGWVADRRNSWTGRVSASYVTGSHVLKVGWQWRYGDKRWTNNEADYSVTLTDGVPVELHQVAKPIIRNNQGMDGGFYIQDQWSRDRMTLNVGLRMDYLKEWVPANDLPAGPYVPARSFAEVKNVPNYKDFSPRFGFVYDLTNDGKTALKLGANRFIVNMLTGIAGRMDPVARAVPRASRDWTDANGDFLPDCDLASVLANGECGKLSNSGFGKQGTTDLGYNASLLTGTNMRNANWELSAQIQRELADGISAEIGFFRRWYSGQVVRDNLLVTPADHDEFCVTAPTHADLPGGGGNQICDLWDVDPELYGKTQRQWNLASDYEGETGENWHGVDTTINVRRAGATLSGGLSTGRLHLTNCAIVDTSTVQFCDTVFPWLTQVKFQGSYTLPYDFQISGVYRNVPGAGGSRASGSNADFRAKRSGATFKDAAAGRVTNKGGFTVQAVPEGTIFQERQQQVDVRVGKSINFREHRFRLALDAYNLLNDNAPQRVTNRIGSTWPKPREIQQPRMLQITGTWDF